MVVECVARPGQGGLAFICEFMQESLSASGHTTPRPWVVVEAPDKRKLFVAGMPTALRMAVADGKILWVRVQQTSQIPEIINLLLESGLCAGVLLRGFENQENLQVWARRWQLEFERTGTHLLWWHEKESDIVLGKMLKLQFESKQKDRKQKDRKVIEVIRGWGIVEDSGLNCLEELSHKICNLKAASQTVLKTDKGENDGQSGSNQRKTNGQTARIA